MIDEGKTSVPLLLSALLLLTACVVTRNDDAPRFSKGDQYLRYGVEAFAAGQPAVAESRFNWALGIFEKNGNLDGQIRAHINLAELAFQTRDMSGTAFHIKRAEELGLQSGEAGYQRRILLIQSNIALHQGNYDRTRNLLTGLLGSIDRQAVNQVTDTTYAAALINRAVLSQRQEDGELHYWIQQLKQSLDAGQEINVSLNARLLRFEAELYRRKGEFNKAEASFNKALLSYESGLFDTEIGATFREWAQLDIEQSHWIQASDKLRRSILLKDAVSDRDGVIEGLQVLAIVESERGRSDDADVIRELVLVLRNNRMPHGTRVPEVIGVLPGTE